MYGLVITPIKSGNHSRQLAKILASFPNKNNLCLSLKWPQLHSNKVNNMNNLVKFFGISVLAFTLTACGGSDDSSSGNGNNANNGSNSGGQNQNNNASNDKINGLYKAFTTCENTGANETEQSLFSRICGQHDIVFANTGNKGVLRFNGALVNWDKMNTGILAGTYDNWQNFYLSVYMTQDEGLGLVSNNTKNHPYSFDQVYANFGETESSYTVEQLSASHYTVEMHSSVQVEGAYFKSDSMVKLDIQLGSSPSADKINGTIKIGPDSTVSFTAQGKPAQNQPLLGLQ